MSITITPVAGALGAIIEGTDPRDPDFAIGPVHQALLEYEVVFFRELHLSADEQLAFGHLLGTPSVYPVARVLGATEPTMTVLEDGPDSPNAADAWHTDITWSATPPSFALLHMEVAPERGGDTIWASATAAFDALSPAMQTFLSGLSVVHNRDGFSKRMADKAGDHAAKITAALDAEYPPVTHPLVRVHPETGKRALFYALLNMSHVEGLTAAESRAVLDFVGDHVKEPSFHCRWSWTEGDLAIWDERSTLHRAAADHWPQRRVIRRLEIDGTRPVGTAITA